MRIKFSSEYLNLRLSYCNKRLAELPRVYRGFHHGSPVIRIRQTTKNGGYKVKEIRPASRNLPAAHEMEDLRKKLTDEINTLIHADGVDQQAVLKIDPTKSNNMNGEFFKSLDAEANSMPIKGNYYHKGIHMRSRLELLVAEILDEINLQYKYEPAIEFNKVVYCPDFIVYIEAIDCCFIIEVLGMTDNTDYMHNSVPKFADYARSGLIISGDLLLIAGTETRIPDTDHIYNSIVNQINLATWRVLV